MDKDKDAGMGSSKPKIAHRARNTRPETQSSVKVRSLDQQPGLLTFLGLVIYKNLYILGITLLRRRNRILRRIRGSASRVRGNSHPQVGVPSTAFVRTTRRFFAILGSPFVRLVNLRTQMRQIMEENRRGNKIPISAYRQVTGTFCKLMFSVFRTLLNYSIPVAAAVLLFIAVSDRLDVRQSVGLAVTYNDQQLGVIVHETVFDEATRILRDRFISEEDIPIVLTPQFTLRELESGEHFLEARTLADMIVLASGGEIDEGFGLYVDNIFLGAYRYIEPILNELDSILESHMTGIEGEEVAFLRSVRVEEGVFPLSSMRSFYEIREHLLSDDPNAPLTSYVVRQDDTLVELTARLNIPYQTLVGLNPQLLNGGLVPGQVLNLPTSQPFMPVANIRTIVFPEEFAFPVEEIETIAYVQGFRSIAVQGQPGVREVTATVHEVNGVEISRQVDGSRILSPPVTQRVIVGTNNPANIQAFGSVSSYGFLWPTEGGVITVGLGGYPGHTGVDIPRPAGTPIFASAAGTVVRVVHSGVGYGRYVVIDHHNGYTTLYAHASATHVSVGQRVNQGDVIASVGRTGNATGNHLHFEVRRNGRIMDPAHYLRR